MMDSTSLLLHLPRSFGTKCPPQQMGAYVQLRVMRNKFALKMENVRITFVNERVARVTNPG